MREDDHRSLFPGALEMMILQILRGRSLHGYALAQHLKHASDDLLRIEEGTLYPALQRMLKEGWVTAEWVHSETNRRVRRYGITSAGRKQLAREVSRFDRMLEGITRVMRTVES